LIVPKTLTTPEGFHKDAVLLPRTQPKTRPPRIKPKKKARMVGIRPTIAQEDNLVVLAN